MNLSVVVVKAVSFSLKMRLLAFDWGAPLQHTNTLIAEMNQCDQIGLFLKFLAANVLTKVAKIFSPFGLFWKASLLSKICRDYFWATLEKWVNFYSTVWSPCQSYECSMTVKYDARIVLAEKFPIAWCLRSNLWSKSNNKIRHCLKLYYARCLYISRCFKWNICLGWSFWAV